MKFISFCLLFIAVPVAIPTTVLQREKYGILEERGGIKRACYLREVGDSKGGEEPNKHPQHPADFCRHHRFPMQVFIW